MDKETERFWKGVIIGLASLIILAILLYAFFPRIIVSLYDSGKEKCCICHKDHHLDDERKANTVKEEFEKTGPIGDTFGGTLGPLIALIAAFLTFLAFFVQYEANRKQKTDLQIERFENKFYSLLEIHRNNVNELYIGKTTRDRKAFISMFNELKFTFFLVEEYYRGVYRIYRNDDPISEEARYNVSYIIFFFGVGPNSSQIVEDLVGERYKSFFLAVERWIVFHQRVWQDTKNTLEPLTVNTTEGFFSVKLKYKPFNGHMSKLSHYVRHLYQLIKFIDSADAKIFSPDDKYNYAATVRSQLSVHEQLLLYYNAISLLGKPWLEDSSLLKKYCLIKSSPITIADFYKRPIDELGYKNSEGRVMFEWSEIQTRFSEL